METLATLQSILTGLTEEQNKTTLHLDALDQTFAGLDQRTVALETSVKALETASTGLQELIDTQGKALDDFTGRVTVLEELKNRILALESRPALDLTRLENVQGLRVVGSAVFTGGLAVDTITSLGDLLTFTSDTEFIGRPYLNSDSGGFAVIQRGTRSVEIVFAREYLEQPVVNATIALDDTQIDTNTSTNIHEVEQAIFDSGMIYLITQKNTKGFTILLNKPAPTDISFSWTAFAVKNPKTFFSLKEEQQETSDTQPFGGAQGEQETNVPETVTEPVEEPASTSEPGPEPSSEVEPQSAEGGSTSAQEEQPAEEIPVAEEPVVEEEPAPVPEPTPAPQPSPEASAGTAAPEPTLQPEPILEPAPESSPEPVASTE